MRQYGPARLREIGRVFLLVHPYWGYYGEGTLQAPSKLGGDYKYIPIAGNPIYGQMLEEHWTRKDLPKVLRSSEFLSAREEIISQYQEGKLTPFMANYKLRKAADSLLRKATPKEVEEVRKRTKKLYKRA